MDGAGEAVGTKATSGDNLKVTKDLVWSVIHAKSRLDLTYPKFGVPLWNVLSMGQGQFADILSFGFSYVEHEDYVVETVVASPLVCTKIIRDIASARLVASAVYIGQLWTAQLYMTDKLNDTTVVFANRDLSVVLGLRFHPIDEEEEIYADV
jgi:hypothetical protein